MESLVNTTSAGGDDNAISALKTYLLRICPAIVNNDKIDADQITLFMESRENMDALAKFSTGTDSSILIIEDSTDSGGEGQNY
jgi:hypothetical protein